MYQKEDNIDITCLLSSDSRYSKEYFISLNYSKGKQSSHWGLNLKAHFYNWVLIAPRIGTLTSRISITSGNSSHILSHSQSSKQINILITIYIILLANISLLPLRFQGLLILLPSVSLVYSGVNYLRVFTIIGLPCKTKLLS